MAKSGGRLRLIFDRRPQNSRERRFVWVRLPAAALMTRLVLEPNEVIRGWRAGSQRFLFPVGPLRRPPRSQRRWPTRVSEVG